VNRGEALAARQHRSGTVLAGGITLLLAAAWAAQHAVHAADYGTRTGGRLAVIWATTFGLLLLQTLMYHLERPARLTPRIRRQLDGLHTAVLIPAYNEDPGYLRLCLQSLLDQTRRPDSVHLVDDGSRTDYTAVRAWWLPAAAAAGIEATWRRVPNGGKRHAQAKAVNASPDADIYITVDSDSCLAPDALEQVLAPFGRVSVQSVAGIVIATNHRGPGRPPRPARAGGHRRRPALGTRAARAAARSRELAGWRGQQLLARITDLWFVTGQLVDRSALSAMGSVIVNSGPLAAYRAGVIRDNLDSYLNERFMGRPVMFSDDSMLTLYALLRGRTVQQPSAVVFSAMPERPGHLLRMYLRWMRGSTIRSIWRLRYLPVNRWAYWAHLMRWAQMALSTVVLGWLLLVEPLGYGNPPPLSFAVVPFLIGWAQGLRYLTITRTDETLVSRVSTWLLMPLAVVWAWTVLRAMRWYGMATCAKTGWGTRQNGAEVTLAGTAAADPEETTLNLPLFTAPHDDARALSLPELA
jgi:hyaluronan synthase